MVFRVSAIAIVVAIALQLPSVSPASVSDVNVLKQRLTQGYNKFTSPAPTEEVVNVNISVRVQAVGDLDEQLEKLTTILSLETVWVDQTMKWDPAEKGIYSLEMDRSEMWVPEFGIFNQHFDISYGVEETIYTPVYYDHTGLATYYTKIVAETFCELDMASFPYDSHDCSIYLTTNKLGAIAITHSMIEDNTGWFYRSEGTWALKNPSIHENVVKITLVRQPTFILVNLIIPMTLLALLSPLVFLLPNNSGERVAFSITLLLATSVFMTMVADQVPHQSRPLPRLLVLLLCSYSTTILEVVIVVMNARIYRIPNKSGVWRVFVWLHCLTSRCCCCFRRRNRSEHIALEEVNGENNVAKAENDGNSHREKEASGKDGRARTWYRSLASKCCSCNIEQYECKEINASVTQAEDEPATHMNRPVEWKDASWVIDMTAMTVIYLLKCITVVIFFGSHGKSV